METVQFVLAIHNHQPVGNFDNVFREAFEKCYDPFVRFLEEHPFLRVSLHYSGCLFDWFEEKEKRFLKRLERLVRHNQIELLGGGYYEPILPLIPERDAIAQLRKMNQYCQRRFGKTPAGFWLTERVWEQKLPRIAADAGLQFTAVDDTHFAFAGLADSEIRDFFITEEEGRLLYVFPIPKALRYSIPFHEPVETIDYLQKQIADKSKPAIVTYADDGEKFGLWPGTYQWVYRDGWLERFAEALLENKSWIALKTFSEVLSENKGETIKKVYLPTASYEEMAEWALSPKKARDFAHLKRELESTGIWSRSRAFFQGGTFKNFLVKYSEVDWMHSRMEETSNQIARLKNISKKRKAEEELWKAQCNCPYWHGVFGGLYLHHLRRATFEHLIRAKEISKVTESRKKLQFLHDDIDHDGAEEVIIGSKHFTFYFSPQRGGSIKELDFTQQNMNLLDTITRREEVYHQDLVEAELGGEAAGKSIHLITRKAPAEVLSRLAFDSYERLSFLDLFLPFETTLEDFWKGKFHLLSGSPTKLPYSKTWETNPGGGILTLKREVNLNPAGEKISIEKSLFISTDKERFELTWKLTNKAGKKWSGLWGSEWSFNFYDREKSEQKISEVELQDGWSPVNLKISSDESFDYWQFPIETVAQTEQDFRVIHQGVSVFPHWQVSLSAGEQLIRHLTFSFSAHPV